MEWWNDQKVQAGDKVFVRQFTGYRVVGAVVGTTRVFVVVDVPGRGQHKFRRDTGKYAGKASSMIGMNLLPWSEEIQSRYAAQCKARSLRQRMQQGELALHYLTLEELNEVERILVGAAEREGSAG